MCEIKFASPDSGLELDLQDTVAESNPKNSSVLVAQLMQLTNAVFWLFSMSFV